MNSRNAARGIAVVATGATSNRPGLEAVIGQISSFLGPLLGPTENEQRGRHAERCAHAHAPVSRKRRFNLISLAEADGVDTTTADSMTGINCSFQPAHRSDLRTRASSRPVDGRNRLRLAHDRFEENLCSATH